jgi:excisionase family DNA binding protein
MLSLSEAAKAAGVSKSTIWRACKAGRLSSTRIDTGDIKIDPAELHRVFPFHATGFCVTSLMRRGKIGTLGRIKRVLTRGS